MWCELEGYIPKTLVFGYTYTLIIFRNYFFFAFYKALKRRKSAFARS